MWYVEGRSDGTCTYIYMCKCLYKSVADAAARWYRGVQSVPGYRSLEWHSCWPPEIVALDLLQLQIVCCSINTAHLLAGRFFLHLLPMAS